MDAIADIDENQQTDLEVRLAASAEEIEAAQILRYKIFYEEMGAKPDAAMLARKIDFDDFDPFCDHLLVIDNKKGGGAAAVVGTYRLMQGEQGRKLGRFYTAGEYDISKLLAYPGKILELGRSCVHADYRNRSTMQKLWRGIASYVFERDIDFMFGCASLPGTDPSSLRVPLSYLYHYHLAPETICPKALPERFTSMNLLGRDELDPRRALASLPPLVKGYLRLGGFVGNGAVIDHQFNTTDVCVIVKTEYITDKYYKHYDRTARETRI